MSSYGHSAILAPLIKDLQHLELTGISFNNHGVDINLCGSLALLVADNLATHAIGGFNECFSPVVTKVCRYCNGTREEISTHFNKSAFECRTVFSHNNQSNIVEEFPQYSTVYGILNELQYFHIIGRQPFDIYHDIYEGLAVDVLSLSIEAFVKARYFSIDILNDRIKNFSYAMFEKTDTPQIITKTGSWDAFRVRQQAVEMSNLFRIFPLLVGDLVPDTDFKWDLLISFFQLVQALASPIFSTGSACYLAGLVEDFLKDFLHEFNISVKPKIITWFIIQPR